MSGDYINRETLRELMYTEAFDRDTGLQRWDSGLWIRFKLFKNCLDTIPAADVAPVRHGRWIPAQDYSNGNEDIECSSCGEWFKSLELCGRLGEPNYCPVCGAKMDGGQEE